jgi:succinylglutamate desuccinylase
MIHPKALEAIKRYLNEALNGCQIGKRVAYLPITLWG